jgi:chromosome segregation ATPase
MHSIFASEIRDLPAELETYYSKYFTDRHQVVAFSDKYQGEFAARQAKVDMYDGQLHDLDEQINRSKGALTDLQKDLSRRRAEVQANVSSGNSSAYQSGATEYNRLVGEYNVLVDRTQQLIAEYNSIVAARNAISTEEQQLQKALDSRLEPAADA